MEHAALIILLALAQYVFFAVRVGAARGKYGVEAPKISGNEAWERLYRVQMNTLEQLIVFIPALWIFSMYTSARWALVPGMLCLLGRQLYSMEYTRDPKTRVTGMSITLLASAVLLIGGLVGVVLSIF